MIIEIPDGLVQSARITYRDPDRKNAVVAEIKKWVYKYDINILGVYSGKDAYAELLEKIPFCNIISVEWLGVPED